MVVAGGLCALAGPAFAGGLFLPGRGVRPMGRGGAFTAGADDLGAVWYNPAGLSFAVADRPRPSTDEASEEVSSPNSAFLIDDSLVAEGVAYTRVDSGGNPQPTVNNSAPPLPPPTLAYGRRVLDSLTIAGALLAPSAALADYPMTGPQRYSMVSLVGSLFLMPEIALAWQPIPGLSVGAGFQDLIVNFNATVVASGCPNRTVCAPEDPDFDSPTQMIMSSAFNPSGNFGVLYAVERVRIGGTLQLPFFINAPGTARIRLPSSAFYNGAQVTGNQIQVAFNLPLEARAGIEVRPFGPEDDHLRLEVELDWEKWSMQNRIAVTPHDISITGVPGIGTYPLGEMDIVRNFHDTFAVHLGAEWRLRPVPATLRGGYTFETGAAPPEYLTVATPDTAKHIIAIGGSYEIGSDFNVGAGRALRLDAAFAYLVQPPVTVTNSMSLQIDPVRDSQPVPVGNGTYSANGFVVGVGVSYRF